MGAPTCAPFFGVHKKLSKKPHQCGETVDREPIEKTV
jgi:hypothetical protein